MTPQDLAYNNSAAVANSAEWVAALAADSAVYRQGCAEFVYGPRARNRVDWFPGEAGKPCLVFIHGGYWQRNAREGFSALAAGVRAHGWSVAMPGYTLAPEARLGEIVAEVWAALGVIGAAFGGELVVSGWSAGGHLAAMGLGHPRVRAGMAISGVFELGPLRETYLNVKLDLSDEEIATLSPMRLEVVEKPLALAYGTEELPALVANSRDFHARRRMGALIPVAGANHFTVLEALRAPDGELTRQLLAL